MVSSDTHGKTDDTTFRIKNSIKSGSVVMCNYKLFFTIHEMCFTIRHEASGKIALILPDGKRALTIQSSSVCIITVIATES